MSRQRNHSASHDLGTPADLSAPKPPAEPQVTLTGVPTRAASTVTPTTRDARDSAVAQLSLTSSPTSLTSSAASTCTEPLDLSSSSWALMLSFPHTSRCVSD